MKLFRILLVILPLIGSVAQGAVAFRQNITAWGAGGGSPQTSGSFTPTATDSIIVWNFDGQASGITLGYSGSVNTPTSQGTINDTTNGNTIGIASVLSATAGAQTLTVSGTAADAIAGFSIEYSGAASASYATSGPLVGTAAPAGSAMSVPPGAILVAFLVSTNGAGGTRTSQASGGITPTSRQNGINFVDYDISEWSNSGGSAVAVTPTWSATSGNYVVLEVLLTPAASGSIGGTFLLFP